MIYKKKSHTGKIVALLLLCILGLSVYGYLVARPTEAQNSGLIEEGSITDDPRGLLTQVRIIESIRLDGSLFSDSVFRSLTDTRVELTPKPVGKANPFAPFASVRAPARSTRSR